MIALLRCLPMLGILGGVPDPAVAADSMDQKLMGQKPIVIIDDAFQFVPGAWANYQVHDKSRGEFYRMRIATLEKQPAGRQPASWMEIEVEAAGTPDVITRLHVLETPHGPGELLDVVVQMKGHQPFNVPKKFHSTNAHQNDRESAQENDKANDKDNDNGIGDFQIARALGRLAERNVRLGDRDILVTDVEARDPLGKPMLATVSEAVPPLGIVSVETESITMRLDSWGTRASSAISGKPINFYLWLLKLIGREVAK